MWVINKSYCFEVLENSLYRPFRVRRDVPRIIEGEIRKHLPYNTIGDEILVFLSANIDVRNKNVYGTNKYIIYVFTNARLTGKVTNVCRKVWEKKIMSLNCSTKDIFTFWVIPREEKSKRFPGLQIQKLAKILGKQKWLLFIDKKRKYLINSYHGFWYSSEFLYTKMCAQECIFYSSVYDSVL